MSRINPFDNLHFKQGIGQQEGINAPSKVDETKTPAKSDETQGIGSIPQTNEDDFVDISDMVDDTSDFSSSDLSQNQNQDQNEIKEEVSQFVDDLLEKQN